MMKQSNMVKYALLGFAALVGLSAMLGSFYTVPDGNVAVVSTFGKYNDSEAMPGLHWKFPFIQSVTTKDVKMQTINYLRGQHDEDASDGVQSREAITILDSKNLPVSLELTLQYTPVKEEMSSILRTYGPNYFSKKINPIVRDITRDVAAGYPAEVLAAKRAEIGAKIQGVLAEAFEELPFDLNQVALRKIVLPATVQETILKVQEAKQEEQRLDMVEKQAEVNKRIAIIDAQKAAEVKIETARGVAESIKVRSIEQAAANKRIALSLTPTLIKQNAIEKWKGEVPTTQLGEGGTSGVLLNLK